MLRVDTAPANDAWSRPPRLAVDVGASNVKMAWLDNDRIVDSSQRHTTFPAVVACRGGDLLIGKDALQLCTLDPAAVLLHVREWLGLVPSVRLAGSEVKIVDAITALYRAAARATVRTTENPASVIVHPAPWPDRRVAMLVEAAGAAGLDVVQAIPDAVAVAAAGPREGDVLVIDVGSVLTVSVVDAGADPPRILWSRSSVGAGGEAIAHAIGAVAQVPLHRARALAWGADVAEDEAPVDWTAVRLEANDGVAAAGRLLNEVLLRSNRDSGAIARIYIAGGASVAPFVREAVRDRFRTDTVDRVFELSGPSASAAYGALRLTRPDPFRNVWDSLGGSAAKERAERIHDQQQAESSRTSKARDHVTLPNSWESPSAGTSSGKHDPETSPAAASSIQQDVNLSNAWPEPASAGDSGSPAEPSVTSARPRSSPNAWPTGPSAAPVAEPPRHEQPTPERPRVRRRRLVAVVSAVLMILVLAIALLLLLA